MSRPERLRWATFTLRGDAQGIVHLDSELPEVIALGTSVWHDFINGTPPMGGAHIEIKRHDDKAADLRVVTPECEFVYTVLDLKQDSEGWFFLLKRTYVSSGYAAWVNSR